MAQTLIASKSLKCRIGLKMGGTGDKKLTSTIKVQ